MSQYYLLYTIAVTLYVLKFSSWRRPASWRKQVYHYGELEIFLGHSIDWKSLSVHGQEMVWMKACVIYSSFGSRKIVKSSWKYG